MRTPARIWNVSRGVVKVAPPKRSFGWVTVSMNSSPAEPFGSSSVARALSTKTTTAGAMEVAEVHLLPRPEVAVGPVSSIERLAIRPTHVALIGLCWSLPVVVAAQHRAPALDASMGTMAAMPRPENAAEMEQVAQAVTAVATGRKEKTVAAMEARAGAEQAPMANPVQVERRGKGARPVATAEPMVPMAAGDLAAVVTPAVVIAVVEVDTLAEAVVAEISLTRAVVAVVTFRPGESAVASQAITVVVLMVKHCISA